MYYTVCMLIHLAHSTYFCRMFYYSQIMEQRQWEVNHLAKHQTPYFSQVTMWLGGHSSPPEKAEKEAPGRQFSNLIPWKPKWSPEVPLLHPFILLKSCYSRVLFFFGGGRGSRGRGQGSSTNSPRGSLQYSFHFTAYLEAASAKYNLCYSLKLPVMLYEPME